MTKLVVVDSLELQLLVETAVRRAVSRGHDDWVDAKTSGLGRRTFLRLGREGGVPRLEERQEAGRAPLRCRHLPRAPPRRKVASGSATPRS